MKWFKHDADANMDAKLRKLRLKYGMEGYGLYWYCLELVARSVEKHNLTFELEHDAELIASDTGIYYERVQEMMTFMIGMGLFENTGGIITCLKMASRTDEYTQQLIRNSNNPPRVSRESPESIARISEVIEENRIEQNRTEEKNICVADAPLRKRFTPPTIDEIRAYCTKRGNSVDPEQWLDHYVANGWKVGKNPMKDWSAAIRTWEKSTGGGNGKDRQPRKASIAERATEHRKDAEQLWAQQEADGGAVGTNDAHLRAPLGDKFRGGGD